ncbi:MAG TPA: hypothetical protein VNA87_05060 [Actinomycetota bacterium]|nr:hypothetical protein [Actinomycetota bacterium]
MHFERNWLLRILALACALILMGSGCNSTKEEDEGGSRGRSRSLSPTSSSSPGGSGSKTSGTPKPSAAPSGGAFVPQASPRGADFLNFGIDTMGGDDPLPKDCPLKPGVRCKVRFRGRYRLQAFPQAYIMVGAYENGSSEPAWSSELPIKRGLADWHLTMPYEPRQETTSVKFLAKMLNPDKELMLTGQPEPIAYTIRN